jgi:hypothetical protein
MKIKIDSRKLNIKGVDGVFFFFWGERKGFSLLH